MAALSSGRDGNTSLEPAGAPDAHKLEPLGGVGIAWRRTGDEHGQGTRNLVLAEPVPGKVIPAVWLHGDMDRMHAVGKHQALAHRRRG